jgi:uncharacterized repeat protein (TIGR01451 family)
VIAGTLLINEATVAGDQAEPTPDPHPNRDTAETLVVVPDQPVPPPTPQPLPDPDGPPQPPAPPHPAPDIPPGPAGTRLALQKLASPTTVSLGGVVNYRLRVSNIGEARALHVRVCDIPAAGLTVSSAPSFSSSGRKLCTTIPKLPVGTRRTFSITARVTSAPGGRVINRATVNARNAPARTARSPITVSLPPPPGLG